MQNLLQYIKSLLADYGNRTYSPSRTATGKSPTKAPPLVTLPPPSQFANSQKLTKRPPPPQVTRTTTSDDAFDADKLIEQLMFEAENDPSLRELSGLNSKKSSDIVPSKPPTPRLSQGSRTFASRSVSQDSRYNSANRSQEQFPFIRDSSKFDTLDDSQSSSSFRYSRPSYSKSDKFSYISKDPWESLNRSKSADARLHGANQYGSSTGLAANDPKLSSFKRTSSSGKHFS